MAVLLGVKQNRVIGLVVLTLSEYFHARNVLICSARDGCGILRRDPPCNTSFLSPHYDDAALSCGGLIAQLAAAGEPVVVATVFGGRPDMTTLSPFARSIHARPGAAGDLIAQRVAEERQALAILGAQGRPGDYLDCIYRRAEPDGRWLYDREEALFGAVDAADDGLVDELAAVFAALAPPADQCVIYAPLAVGNHVDHQVVQRAAMKLHDAAATSCTSTRTTRMSCATRRACLPRWIGLRRERAGSRGRFR